MSTQPNLRKTHLEQANLEDALLEMTDLQGAQFRSAKLNDAFLSGVNLQSASLWAADLQQAKLSGVNLQGATLLNADLQGASLMLMIKLQGAFLLGANLRDALLGAVEFDEKTTWPDGKQYPPDTDMRRFTDPTHPDFWRSDNPASPAYREMRE